MWDFVWSTVLEYAAGILLACCVTRLLAGKMME